jgi:hypothetical protein
MRQLGGARKRNRRPDAANLVTRTELGFPLEHDDQLFMIRLAMEPRNKLGSGFGRRAQEQYDNE